MIALAGALLLTCFVTSSAQAASLPVLKSNANDDGIVTLVGRRGGGFSGGRSFRGAGARVNVGNVGARRYVGGGVGRRVNVGNVNRRYYGAGINRRYAYKNNYDYPYRRYGYRRFGWGLPYVTAGYAGGCGWLYRRAVSTGSSYWWNRYNACTGQY
jgi:hypothetical protein